VSIAVERLVLGDLDTNCWIVSDGRGGPLMVIDPAGDDDDAERLVEAIDDRDIAAIVLTHGHFDHLGSVERLVEVSGAPVAVHELDAPRITDPAPAGTGGALFGYDHVSPPADRILRGGDRVDAGAVSLRVLHTPGHTKGSISLYGEGHLFSGDTLFAGSVGRTDFPGGDPRDLSQSIAREIAPLPDGTVVHPGHGPDTVIGRERRVNPFFPRA
jgi:glyoxylase-like metal-dependent hydrolase (beta-lactamase superfamily II)